MCYSWKILYEDKKMDIKQDKHYWMLLCNPSKWFEECSESAKVNEILFNLEEYAWTTGKSLFKGVSKGDLGIIKVGNDTRSKACRTVDGELVEKLEAGIYAIVEFIEKDGTVLHHDENKIRRVHFRVIKNLYKDDCIIKKKDTEMLLQNNFKSFSSKRIPQDIFSDIETFLGVKF